MRTLLAGAALGLLLFGPATVVVLAEQKGCDRLLLGMAIAAFGVLGAWMLALAEHKGKVKIERDRKSHF